MGWICAVELYVTSNELNNERLIITYNNFNKTVSAVCLALVWV